MMFILGVMDEKKEGVNNVPIYQYKCLTEKLPEEYKMVGEPCNHEYEVFYTSVSRAETDEPSEACPKCGGKEKERLISTGTSHILKGKGWFYNGGY